MQACMDWVLRFFGTQVTKKKRPLRPVFPDYLSFSYDYVQTNLSDHFRIIFALKTENMAEKHNVHKRYYD